MVKKRVQENMNHKTVKVMYEALRLCGHKVLDEHLQFGFTNYRLLILTTGEHACSQI